MATNSHISWCDNTHNEWWGCTRCSEGCQECYAKALSQTRQNKNSSNITPSKHSDLVEAFIGHSYDSNKYRGAYSTSTLGQPNSCRTKTMPARSDWEVQLSAILQVLKLPLGDCKVVIYSSDESLMAHLSGGSLWRWRENGWRRSNGELIQCRKLLAQIADKMSERSVEFASDLTTHLLSAVQAEAVRALREWRKSSTRRTYRW